MKLVLPNPKLDEAERSVIGAVLSQNGLLERLTLTARDFSHPARALIWTGMLELEGTGRPIDELTILDQLNGRGQHAVEELAVCGAIRWSVDNVEFHAEIVADGSRMRQVRLALAEIAHDESLAVDELLNRTARVLDVHGRSAAKPTVLPRRTSAEHVDEILARASEPWVCLGLAGTEIARLRLGSIAAIIGAPGAGKSTLVAALLAEHAHLHGPAIYLSLELGADEVLSRVIGMTLGQSWEDVLRGRVPRVEMLGSLPTRLEVRDRDVEDVTVDQLAAIVAQARASHAEEPILAAVDYIQLAAGDGPDVRARVSAIAETLRRAARQLRIAVLAVSQTSRAAGQQLRDGELVGAATMAAGAESSGIERAAYLTLAIGAQGPAREDGAAAVSLHVGKGRFGGGDRVLPMMYSGRTGRWCVSGASRTAAEVATARAADHQANRVQTAQDAVLAAAGRAPRPQSRSELRVTVELGRDVVWAAIDALLEAGTLVECERANRSQTRLLWTPARVQERRADQAAADARRMGDAP